MNKHLNSMKQELLNTRQGYVGWCVLSRFPSNLKMRRHARRSDVMYVQVRAGSENEGPERGHHQA